MALEPAAPDRLDHLGRLRGSGTSSDMGSKRGSDGSRAESPVTDSLDSTNGRQDTSGRIGHGSRSVTREFHSLERHLPFSRSHRRKSTDTGIQRTLAIRRTGGRTARHKRPARSVPTSSWSACWSSGSQCDFSRAWRGSAARWNRPLSLWHFPLRASWRHGAQQSVGSRGSRFRASSRSQPTGRISAPVHSRHSPSSGTGPRSGTIAGSLDRPLGHYCRRGTYRSVHDWCRRQLGCGSHRTDHFG